MANMGWVGGTSSVYGLDANWVGNDAPDGNDSAFFKISSRKTIDVDGSNSVQRWDIDVDGYDFRIAANKAMTFSGAGITGSSTDPSMSLRDGSTANFLNASTAGKMTFVGDGQINFAGSSNAGDARFFFSSIIQFGDQSSAATSSFSLNTNSQVRFTGSSSAGTAVVTGAQGSLAFSNSSTAANAFITTGAAISFVGSSNAGSSNIRSSGAFTFDGNSSAKNATLEVGSLIFYGQSSAADAQIDASGTVGFLDHTTAANARLIANRVVFGDNSTPGNASILFSGEADFSAAVGPNGDHRLSVGSLGGSGVLKLGGNELTIGSSNTSSALTGNITGDAPGASIVKVGSGVLSMSGNNTYAGSSTVHEGVLQIDGTVSGNALAVDLGTLAGVGTIKGAVSIGVGATLAPGHDASVSPTDTKGALKVGGLTFQPRSSFAIEIGGIAAGVQHDIAVVNGAVSIGVAATLDATLTDSFAPSLTAHQSFLIVENDGTDAISGHFEELVEGATFVVANRLFSISYVGGTGNDVVLTSQGAVIVGTDGADTISKNTAPTGQLKATKFSDLIFGLGGKDTINAGGGNDTVLGGRGKDVIDGGKGSDTADYNDKSKTIDITLDGSNAVTVKVGGKVEDTLKNVESLIGGNEADTFTGDSKDNRFEGGLGKDAFKGNGGEDHFVFSTAAGKANADTISDFRHGTDKIALDEAIFAAIGDKLGKAEFYAKAGAHAAHDANDRIIYNTTNGKLYFDADGKDGPASAMLFATLSNHPGNLAHADFLIV